ncbi:sugar ABC transporter permease [Microbacterium sp. Leaf288]|uniref:ABC transporter permease n=1 Tax=Microbacterium sp. Leaf288 TaxID=1736323 RepID=UPI0006F9156A|nr:ABC transporter permease [Microbacterium sp. Leaf288]KQP69197.1 sugar ABC transporter permease [Microbacterium sp. Leaf288]
MTQEPSPAASALRSPGAGLGLIDVLRRRHLLALLVRKEVQIRYRGSVLGWLWSYVKPLVQFAVFFVALGIFLGLNSSIEFYPVYLLAGFTAVTFFSEAFQNGTKSIVDNAPLIKKIYLPRELFPVASMLVATVNVLPQVLVVWVIAIVFGWQFSFAAVGAIVLGFLIIAILSTGLGLLFGAINVAFRDAQSFVEIIIMCAMWASPVMYQWSMVQQQVSAFWFDIYRLNPLTPAVELFHFGFWLALDPEGGRPMPDLALYSLYALIVAVAALVIGQVVFRKLEGRFAQEL